MPRRRIRRRVHPEKIRRSGKSGTDMHRVLEEKPTNEPDHPVLQLQRTIGNQATTALMQRRKEPGSATMVSSAGTTEVASDLDSFTTQLIEDLADDQISTEQELLGSMEMKATETNLMNNKYTQHPNMAQMGIRPEYIKGFKVGVYIGNSDYRSLGFLGGAKADAEEMKSTMEGHNYASLPLQEDKTARELDTIFSLGVRHAKTFGADALLLYYAGHGTPEGLIGVDAGESEAVSEEGNRGVVAGERGIKMQPEQKGVVPYSNILQHLAGSVENGVHTALIVDACYSSAGTELFRAKAVERLSKNGNIRTKAVTEQIARLEALKSHLPFVIEAWLTARQQSYSRRRAVENVPSATRGSRSRIMGPTLEGFMSKYWTKVVHPELKLVNTYLTKAGLGMDLPETLGTYSLESIQQQINMFINKLIKLVETIQQEEEESTLEKAGA